MKKTDLLTRVDLLSAIDELYLLGFISRKNLDDLSLVVKVASLRASKKHPRQEAIYEEICNWKDVYLCAKRIKEIDLNWKRSIPSEVLFDRWLELERLHELLHVPVDRTLYTHLMTQMM